jgi:enoyl-CoA hydratase/carnithine racemase
MRGERTAMTTPLVHYEITQGVATLTLDSPENRNALSATLLAQLLAHLERAANDEAVAVLLKSSGTTFCSGLDLAEAAELGMEAGTRALVALQRAIAAHPLPVVVSLSGPVRAGGLGIVTASDIAICSDQVTFAFTEARLGLAPAAISLTVLQRLTSRAAAETFLTGRVFGAAEAQQMGLVSVVVPAQELDAAVESTMRDLRTAHRQGLQETKALLAAPMLARIDAGAEEMARLSANLFASPVATQAMQAFLNKRRTP